MKANNTESRSGSRRHAPVALHWAVGPALAAVVLGAAVLKTALDTALPELPPEAVTPSPDPAAIDSNGRRGGRRVAGSLSRWSNPMPGPIQ